MTLDPRTLPEEPFPRLQEVMRLLRSPAGCPWDREQDHRSLRPHLLEECWEVLAVLDEAAGPNDERLLEELGDLLLQVAFHAQIASERGAFDLTQVAIRLVEKLIRRHPHVFGEGAASDSGEVFRHWEAIKRAESAKSPAERPLPLPALLEATRMLAKAERAGFPGLGTAETNAQVVAGLAEVNQAASANGGERLEEKLGDLLLAVVSWGCGLGVDAESALRRSVGRFRARYDRWKQAQSSSTVPGGGG